MRQERDLTNRAILSFMRSRNSKGHQQKAATGFQS